MIYLCLALYALGFILAIALTEAYEELNKEDLGRTTKVAFSLIWPLIALLVFIIPNKLVVNR